MDTRGHNVSASITSSTIILSIYMVFNQEFYKKFLDTLNWNLNLKLNENFINLNYIHSMFPLFNLNNISFLSYSINTYIISIFLIPLLIYMGGIFPDLDQTILKPYKYSKIAHKNRTEFGEEEGKKKNAYLYQSYHRQCTHSPLNFLFLFSSILYFNFVEKSNFILFIYYLEIGIATHLIADIFVGSGGIPSFCSAKWNSKNRIKFKILENNNILTKWLVYFHFTVLLILSIWTRSIEMISILIMYSYFIQIKTSQMLFYQGIIIFSFFAVIYKLF